MDEDEIRKSASLEETHWWYVGRRALVRSLMQGIESGRALDVGAGSGGNASVLRDLGWDISALEYSPTAAQLSRSRGLPVVRGDARHLPFGDECFDLVMSMDMWEHVDDDAAVARESFRVTRPGGRLLVAVPSGMDLWSDHDIALGHYRRYERSELVSRVEAAGYRIHDVQPWNVLLRPVAKARRRITGSHSTEGRSEMEAVHPVINAGLRSVVALESRLPVSKRRGISLVVRAFRPRC